MFKIASVGTLFTETWAWVFEKDKVRKRNRTKDYRKAAVSIRKKSKCNLYLLSTQKLNMSR